MFQFVQILGGLIVVIFIITLAFISGSMITLLFIDKKVIKNIRKPKNNVHFYVARDKNGSLYLYLCKPVRDEFLFLSSRKKSGRCMGSDSDLKMYGLNENDYKDLKWEDEPLEVFVNIEG